MKQAPVLSIVLPTLLFLFGVSFSTTVYSICTIWWCPCENYGGGEHEEGCDDVYNTTRDVNDPSDWRVYFHPKISVRPSGILYATQDTGKDMTDGQCSYVAPTNVKAYKTKCSKNLKPCNKCKGAIDCICAENVTSCTDDNANAVFNPVIDRLIGCHALTLPPPPPPFENNLSGLIAKVTIVPVKESSSANPVIKVRVGLDTKRKCSNGKEVSLSSSCAPDVTKEILSYQEEVLKPGGKASLWYNGVVYDFSAYLEGNKICARYDAQSASEVQKQCYDLYSHVDPEIISYTNNQVTLKYEGYNKGAPFTLAYGQEKVGLSLSKPFVEHKRQFKFDKKGKVLENPNGNVLCVIRGDRINDLMVTRDQQLLRFRGVEREFIPLKYSGKLHRNIEDKSRGRFPIHATPQNVLDTIILNIDGSFSIMKNLLEREKFAYTSVAIGKSHYMTFDQKEFQLLKSEISCPVQVDDRSGCIQITDAFRRNLCFPGFGHSDYSTAGEYIKHIDMSAEKCRYVTIEALGGGGSSYINVSDFQKSYSGTSGGYTKATIPLDPTSGKHTFKVKVGKGGDSKNRAGGDTEVLFCNDDESGCERLLLAKGGQHNKVGKGEVSNKDLFDVTFLESNPGLVPVAGNDILKPTKSRNQLAVNGVSVSASSSSSSSSSSYTTDAEQTVDYSQTLEDLFKDVRGMDAEQTVDYSQTLEDPFKDVRGMDAEQTVGYSQTLEDPFKDVRGMGYLKNERLWYFESDSMIFFDDRKKIYYLGSFPRWSKHVDDALVRGYHQIRKNDYGCEWKFPTFLWRHQICSKAPPLSLGELHMIDILKHMTYNHKSDIWVNKKTSISYSPGGRFHYHGWRRKKGWRQNSTGYVFTIESDTGCEVWENKKRICPGDPKYNRTIGVKKKVLPPKKSVVTIKKHAGAGGGGGGLDLVKKQAQEGSDGMVRLICEQWEK